MKRFLFLCLLPISLILSVACPDLGIFNAGGSQNSGSAGGNSTTGSSSGGNTSTTGSSKVTSAEWERAINALIDRNVDELITQSNSNLLAKDGDSENSKLPLTGKTSGYVIKFSIRYDHNDSSLITANGNEYVTKTWFVKDTIEDYNEDGEKTSRSKIRAEYQMGENSFCRVDKDEDGWSVRNIDESAHDDVFSMIKNKYNDAEFISDGYKITGYYSLWHDEIYETTENLDDEDEWYPITVFVKFNSNKQLSNMSIEMTRPITLPNKPTKANYNYAIEYSDDLKYDFGEVIPNFQ